MIKRGLVGYCAVLALGAAACVVQGESIDPDEGAGGSYVLDSNGGSTGRGTKEVGDLCSETEECVPGSICFNEYCVGAGTLRVSLAFSVDSDFDLHLVTPSGTEIFYDNTTAAGGDLDVDQCVSSCGSGSHVENIVFANSAASGNYSVWVENYNGRSAGSFSIEVAGVVSRTFQGSLPATSKAASEHFAFTVAGGAGNGAGGSSSSGGSSGSSSTAGSSSGGSSAQVDCESSCPSEFPNDAQLDAFCRMTCCYDLTGQTEARQQTCLAGESLGTSSCNHCP